MKKIRNAIEEAEVYAKLPFPLRLHFAEEFVNDVLGEGWRVWRVVEEELDGQQRDNTI